MPLPGTAEVPDEPLGDSAAIDELASQAYSANEYLDGQVQRAAGHYMKAAETRARKLNRLVGSAAESAIQGPDGTPTVEMTLPPVPATLPPLPASIPPLPPGSIPPPTPTPFPPGQPPLPPGQLPPPPAPPPMDQGPPRIGPPPGDCPLDCPPGYRCQWNDTLQRWECVPEPPPPGVCLPPPKPPCRPGYHAVLDEATCKWHCVCDDPSCLDEEGKKCVESCCPKGDASLVKCIEVKEQLTPPFWVSGCCFGPGDYFVCCWQGWTPPAPKFGVPIFGPVANCADGQTALIIWLKWKACEGQPPPIKPPCHKGKPPECPERHNPVWSDDDCAWKCVEVLCQPGEEIYRDPCDGLWKCRPIVCTGQAIQKPAPDGCGVVCVQIPDPPRPNLDLPDWEKDLAGIYCDSLTSKERQCVAAIP